MPELNDKPRHAHSCQPATRHDWRLDEALALFNRPFGDLLFEAQSIHRRCHRPNEVQISTLLSIKTGGCPEDCKYCPQSIHYDTGLETHNLLPVEDVLDAAGKARAAGATRFCMGAAWRGPSNSQTRKVCQLIRAVKGLGMETCATLGMLTAEQARQLAEAGLDFYNHNLDSSPEYYGRIISTRTYQDRLETLGHVRDAGLKVCCGGIVGMGESRRDRAGLLVQLANLPAHPQSVPINNLVQVEGTPLHGAKPLPPLELARCIAVARILMPHSVIRLSAGRTELGEEAQALCFLAGAGSIFCGDRLLTTPNPVFDDDMAMFENLGLAAQPHASREAPREAIRAPSRQGPAPG